MARDLPLRERGCRVERGEIPLRDRLCPGDPPSRVRVASFGFDPVLCGLGGFAFGSPVWSTTKAGLRVPSAPTRPLDVLAGQPLVQEYLFQTATLKVGVGERAKIVGLGQMVTIGELTNSDPPVFPLVLPVTSTDWRFSDGMVTWALRFVRQWPQIPPATQTPLTTDSFVKTWSDSPALIFDTASFDPANLDWRGHPDNYLALTGYTAPYADKFIGEPLGNLGQWTSLDYPYNDPGRKAFEPIEVEGPGAIVLWCRVRQTDHVNRATVTLPAGPLLLQTTMPEDAAVAAFPSMVYWGVGGWLEVER